MDAGNFDANADADADLDDAEERGVPSVAEKHDGAKNLIPIIGFGVVVAIGLLIMWQGLKPQGRPETLIPADPSAQFSTGVQGGEQIPAFAPRETPNAAAQPPQPVRPLAPPIDRAGQRLQSLRERQRLDLERMEREQELQLRGAREALDLQRQTRSFQSEVEMQRALKSRREAPALIFDDSKDEE